MPCQRERTTIRDVRGFFHILAALVVVLPASSAAADVSVGGLADASFGAQAGGHGAGLIDWRHGVGIGTAVVTLNTDTVRAGLHRVRLADGLQLEAQIAGQALLAGVSSDYWVRGELLPDRGFASSWLGGHVQLAQRVGRRQVTTVRIAPRRHLFGAGEQTSIRVPDDFTVVEQAVGYTYWGFDPDVMDWRPHQWFLRLRGFGFGAEAQSHLRSRTGRWGHPDDPRNDPAATIFIASQWAALGVDLAPGLRLQFREEARVGFGEDDITRQRIGGQNPYVVQLAGAPWPGFLSSHVLAGHVSLHWNAFGQSELGVAADVVALDDPGRTGSDDFGVLGGGALFADLRFGRWQVDARVGAAVPTRWLEGDLNVGVLLGVGLSL